MRCRVLDLDKRSNQRRSGLAAEACSFALRLSEDGCKLRDLRLCLADPVIDGSEKRGEAILLLRDLRSGSTEAFTSLHCGVPDPADLRLG